MAYLLRNFRQISGTNVALPLIVAVVMSQISLYELDASSTTSYLKRVTGNIHEGNTKSCSKLYHFYCISHFTCDACSTSDTFQNEVHFQTDEIKNREQLTADESYFHFLSTIYKKIYAGWLQGRTTPSKTYFDDLYISLTREIFSAMQDTENDRWSQLQHLSRIVHEKIDRMQNPSNCSEAKLLVYDIRWHRCGFGCNLHNIIMFFMQSIYANRTFVLQSAGWNYDRRGWEHHLLPLGKCKYKFSALDLPLLSDETEHMRVVTTVETEFEDIDFAVPSTILSRLEKIHAHPYVWWVGQFVAYAFRIQPWMKNQLQEIGNRMDFTDKIAGIQVRWGDKLDEYAAEALKHEVDEYMDFVETWFRIQDTEGKKLERVVFVATENSEVWVDLKARYPEYRFIGGGYVTNQKDLEPQKMGDYENRQFALESIITDLYFLSKCSYVVCTFSSNVCTAAYELMTLEKADAPMRIQSLDVAYRVYRVPFYTATERHMRESSYEMSMEVGDEIFGEHNPHVVGINGSCRGGNTNSEKDGEVPSYKLKLFVEPLDIPVFDDLELCGTRQCPR